MEHFSRVKFTRQPIRIRHKLMQSLTSHSPTTTCHGRQKWIKTLRMEDQQAMWRIGRWFQQALVRSWSRRSNSHRHKEANSIVALSMKGFIEAQYKNSKVSRRDHTHTATQTLIYPLNGMTSTNSQLLRRVGRQDQQPEGRQYHRHLQPIMANGSIREG